LLLVDMKVAKDGTEFVSRSDSQIGAGPKSKVHGGEKGPTSCMDLFYEFQSFCIISLQQTGSKLEVEWSQLPHLSVVL